MNDELQNLKYFMITILLRSWLLRKTGLFYSTNKNHLFVVIHIRNEF